MILGQGLDVLTSHCLKGNLTGWPAEFLALPQHLKTVSRWWGSAPRPAWGHSYNTPKWFLYLF